MSSTTAVCFAGQFRTFAQTARHSRSALLEAFRPAADAFIFVNLQDTGKGGRMLHTEAELQSVLAVLRPIAVARYTQRSYDEASSGWNVAPCSWKNNGHKEGPNLWSVTRCFALIGEYESQRMTASSLTPLSGCRTCKMNTPIAQGHNGWNRDRARRHTKRQRDG